MPRPFVEAGFVRRAGVGRGPYRCAQCAASRGCFCWTPTTATTTRWYSGDGQAARRPSRESSCGRDDRRPLGNGCGCSVAPPRAVRAGGRQPGRGASPSTPTARSSAPTTRRGRPERLRNRCVELAPAIFRGKPTGAVLHARARLLDGEEARLAAGALARRRRLLQGMRGPARTRLIRYRTMHSEAEPTPSAAASLRNVACVSPRWTRSLPGAAAVLRVPIRGE